jgi:Gram-negative bacterial TonB protein C-terminal
MAPTTISIARVLQLRVPIAWQEAVEVACAAELTAELHARRLTVEGCLISTAGTVEVGTNGTDRLGADLSALQLLALLLEGQQAPAELRALAATADDPLSSFPSESTSPDEHTLTLDWFVRPNPEVEIASLATRALEAAAPAVETHQATAGSGPDQIGRDRSAPMTFDPRPGERRPQPPVVEVAPTVRTQWVPEHPADLPKPAAVEHRAAAPTPAVPEHRAEPPTPVVERPAEPPPSAVVEHRAAPPTPAVPGRRAEPPEPLVIERPAVRPQPVMADRPMRHEPAGAERGRERPDPAAVVARLRAEVLDRPAPPGTSLQIRPATHAVSHQLSAVIDRGRRVGAPPLVVMAVGVVVAGGLVTWALLSPGMPAPLRFSNLGPLTPYARPFEPNRPVEGRRTPSREMPTSSVGLRPSSPDGVGTSGTAASPTDSEGLRLATAATPVLSALPSSEPADTPGVVGPAGQSASLPTPTFDAPPRAAPTAVAATVSPSSAAVAPSPAGRVVATPLEAQPRDRRVYTADDADVEPPAMRRPQLQRERRADTEPSDSYVEVVIDELGEVTQVRLHSSDLSLNDRMIVAAAKAWQFQPAMKDGRPVKYVLRLPVTR